MTARRTAWFAARPTPLELASRPLRIGRLVFPPPVVIVLAAIGLTLLVTVGVLRWATPSDEHAYWLAARRLLDGVPLYDLSVSVGTPYAYWYPPPLAQVLAPLTAILGSMAFSWAWTLLLLACLLFLADRRILVAIALVAFLPVAVELWYRNVHLVLAAVIVMALRRHPAWWVVAAAIKVTPAIGLLYLLAARRYRDVVIVGIAGLAVLAVSIAVSPAAWAQFLDLVRQQGGSSGASLVDVPFPVRLAAAAGLALAGGRIGGRRGEALLVTALVVGNPTLWATAFSLLIAIVPLWRRSAPDGAPRSAQAGSGPAGAARVMS